MTIKVGDKLPDGKLSESTEYDAAAGCRSTQGLERRRSGQRQENRDLRRAGRVYADLLGEARPSYVKNYSQLKAKGIGRESGGGDQRRLRHGRVGPRPEGGARCACSATAAASDQEARLELDLTAAQHGRRSQRYSMLVGKRRGEEIEHRKRRESTK